MGCVQHSVVLDVDPVADAYGSDISAEHCSIPDAAVISNSYTSDDCSAFCNERAFAYNRSVTLKFLDYCHILFIATSNIGNYFVDLPKYEKA
jgi:hypothetical protein